MFYKRVSSTMQHTRKILVLVTTILFLALLNSVSAENEDQQELIKSTEVVTTNSGKVRGLTGRNTRGKKRPLYWFKGIPFAEPPVGELRFEPPLPKKPWDGILNATQSGPVCIQNAEPIQGSEDCLYLEIYTTTAPDRRNKLPVMVWVYGGAFFAGSADFDDHSPDYLLDEDIIAVSFHYRLGIMGFLSTGDRVAPGNNGIRDQILALKWIKENIEYFGGDPDRITVFGQSAGAASIAYLLQTNETKGLFSQAIIQSGSSLSSWALSRTSPKLVKSVAQSLRISTKTSQSMITGLKRVDAEKLVTTSLSEMKQQLLLSNPLDGLVFGPVIEPDHEGAIISGKSHELLKNGQFHHIPLIVGHTSLEAMYTGLSVLVRAWLLRYDADSTTLIPHDMGSSILLRSLIGASIKLRYFGLLPIATSNENLMRFITDDQFERPIQQAIQLYSAKTPVYFYRFSYQGPLYGILNRSEDGVGHTEDLGYIFDFGYNGTEQDYLTRSRMVKLWTNFVKEGNPTPKNDSLLQNIIWPANQGGNGPLTCLDVDKNLTIDDSPNQSNIDYWNYLYSRYGRPPYDTY